MKKTNSKTIARINALKATNKKQLDKVEAKDKAEFDQFMQGRKEPRDVTPQS